LNYNFKGNGLRQQLVEKELMKKEKKTNFGAEIHNISLILQNLLI
jgi:hypothetical protein